MNRVTIIWKGISIILICAICSMLTFYLHDVTTPSDYQIEGELSILAQGIGTKGAVLLWGFAAFLLISVIYIVYEKNLRGNGIERAMIFGGLTGLTWFVQMMEMDQNLTNLLMGLVDSIMVMVVCMLMAVLISPKREKGMNRISIGSREMLEIMVIMCAFAAYRLLFGVFLGKYYNEIGDYLIIPVYSLLMGVMWVYLKGMPGKGSFERRTSMYSFIIWGIPSSIFMYFMAFCFSNMLIGLTIRNLMDMTVMFLCTRHFAAKECKIQEANEGN